MSVQAGGYDDGASVVGDATSIDAASEGVVPAAASPAAGGVGSAPDTGALAAPPATGAVAPSDAAAAPASEAEALVLSVVSGNPTDEELAALTAVVVALHGQHDADDAPDQARSWVRRALLRLGPTPGPGSWRRSGR